MRVNPSYASRCVLLAACAWGAASASAQQFVEDSTNRFPQPDLLEYTNQAGVCDIDGDGDLDIAWANGQGYSSQGAALKVRVFVNNGAGVFTDETDARTGGLSGWFRGVEFGDCDRDGDWDMILAQDFNKRPQLLINDGTGHFANETNARLPNITMSSARAQFGDVDNDGDLDLVFCNSGTTNRFGSGPPKLFLNNGAGVYSDVSAAQLPAGNVTDQQDIIFGDVDRDLDLDIRVGSRVGQSRIWINNGAGTFTNLAGVPTDASTYSYDFGDIEGDGDLDLLGANSGPTNSELLLRNNHPSATWTNVSTQIIPNLTVDDNDSKFFDYDNDGDLDLVIARIGGPERVYNNNGAGTFSQVSGVMTSITDSSLDVKVADFNDDGRLDIITAQGESGSFRDRIYMNNGPVDTRPPTFQKIEQLPDSATTGPFVVRAEISDGMTSDRGFHDKGISLRYSINGGPVQQTPMAWSGNELYRGVIPAGTCGTIVYSVRATDFANNTAASAAHTFTALKPGDIDLDCDVDAVDRDLFVLVLLGVDTDPGHVARSDVNGSGGVDGEDIPEFVQAVLMP